MRRVRKQVRRAPLSQGLNGQLVRVQRLVPGGSGMGHLRDGRTFFADGAIAGDEIIIGSCEEKKRHVVVKSFTFSERSHDRVKSRCEISEVCGGCDWIELAEDTQQEAKLSIVRQAMERTGKVDSELLDSLTHFHPSPRKWNYRARVRLRVEAGRLGFFRKESHRFVELDKCEVASEALQAAISLVREVVRLNQPAFQSVQSVEIRALGPEDSTLSPQNGSAHFVLKRSQGGDKVRPCVEESLQAAVATLEPHLQVRFDHLTAPLQRYDLTNQSWIQVPIGGFTQVNDGVNRLLISHILSWAQCEGAKNFLDLYCGSGNFSIPLLKAGLTGIGVELNAEAVSAARAAAREQGLEGAFETAACTDYLRQRRASHPPLDLMLLDPPRAGAKDLLDDVLAVAPRCLVMVSCDPVTLARDIRILLDGGASLAGLDVFDMFPQTHHAETVAILRIKPAS